MIDFQNDQATIYWTYDSIAAHRECGKGDQIWTEEVLNSTVVSVTNVRFDPPDGWDYGGATLRFVPGGDGYWRYQDEGTHWKALRHDSCKHTVLVGTWREEEYHGAFVAVIPRDSPRPAGGRTARTRTK